MVEGQRAVVGKDILIVDDTPDNLRVLDRILVAEGYKVRKALSGEMALTACQTRVPDLILLDILMPSLDGYEVCQRLKLDEKTSQIPVIFISALDQALDKVKAFSVGGVDYITKPFQSQEVLVRIANQLAIQNLQKQLTERNEALLELNQNLERMVEQKTQRLLRQEKNAAIGRLAQGIVNNLKNPLSRIVLASNLIQAKVDNIAADELLKYLSFITSAYDQMAKVMDSLLLKTNREQTPEFKFLNLNEIVEHEVQLLNASYHFSHEVNKSYLLDQSLSSQPLIYSHISQIFNKLVENALEAMKGQTHQELTIITRQDESNIYLEIQDTGCGIPSEELSNIFDPFYTSKPVTGDGSEGEKLTGSGLGLYTCLELLKIFNGDIKVVSEVGKGSTFTVSLPKPSL